ncbi:hypothetical protein [Actinoplanes sp. NPDC051411]|uniref:hypothetical protein n=1 Tax=Actinoplanes sp. NPDC051411 TaxID=3155522 RepID=UPI003420CF90
MFALPHSQVEAGHRAAVDDRGDRRQLAQAVGVDRDGLPAAARGRHAGRACRGGKGRHHDGGEEQAVSSEKFSGT